MSCRNHEDAKNLAFPLPYNSEIELVCFLQNPTASSIHITWKLAGAIIFYITLSFFLKWIPIALSTNELFHLLVHTQATSALEITCPHKKFATSPSKKQLINIPHLFYNVHHEGERDTNFPFDLNHKYWSSYNNIYYIKDSTTNGNFSGHFYYLCVC